MSNIKITISDTYCQWEYGFTFESMSIARLIKCIEEKYDIKSDYSKLVKIESEEEPLTIEQRLFNIEKHLKLK